MAYKIFLSYWTGALPEVRECRDILKQPTVEVFLADESVREGEKLTPTIQEAVRECDLFTLMWSAGAKGRPWVHQEIGAALSQKKKILPILLDDSKLPDNLRDVKYFKAHDDVGAMRERLRELVRSEAEKKGYNELAAITALGMLLYLALK